MSISSMPVSPLRSAKLRAKQAKKPDVKQCRRKSVLNYLFLGLVYFLIFGLLFSIYVILSINQPSLSIWLSPLFLDHFPRLYEFYNVFYKQGLASSFTGPIPSQMRKSAYCILPCPPPLRKDLSHPDPLMAILPLVQLFSDSAVKQAAPSTH